MTKFLLFPVRLAYAGVVMLLYIVPTANAEPLTIGLMTELSGEQVALGRECKLGFAVAEKIYLKGDEQLKNCVRLRYGDAQGKVSAAVSEFQKLTTQERAAIIVATRSSVCMSVNPLSKERHVPLLCAAGHHQFIQANPYAYRFWPTTENEAQSLAIEIAKRDLRTIASITVQDEWTVSLEQQLKQHLQKRGISILIEEFINPDQVDFAAVVSRIKKRAPDGIFVNVAVEQIGPLIRRLREQAVGQPIFSNFRVREPGVRESAGSKNLEGLTFVEMSSELPQYQHVLNEISGGSESNSLGYACFAGLSMALLAVKEAGCNRENIIENLKGIETLKLPDELLAIEGREVKFPLVVKSFHDGKVSIKGSRW